MIRPNVTFAAIFSLAMSLAGCGPTNAPSEATGTDAAVVEAVAADENEALSIEAVLAGDWREPEAKDRDVWRHPAETIAFFGIEPSQTVVETWPGGGWYTQILAPYLNAGGGRYIAAGFPNTIDFFRNAQARFDDAYVGAPEIYGPIEQSVFAPAGAGLAPEGEADAVLTFRNVHNWMSQGYESEFFDQAFKALKPGGVLGVVEHRLPSGSAQDPQATNGYVHEDYVIALAEAAGFEFVGSSEINANPKDTADHPFGVWTLPPVGRTSDADGGTPDGFDPEIYKAIGESDRMTLKFVKPQN
ncbi:MAG: hypothetical protein AAFQ67_05355 [Pseudomonadota bacterium]